MKDAAMDTLCVHSGTIVDEAYPGVNTPVYTSSSYGYLDTEARIYPRYFNTPNQGAIVEKLCALEKAEAGLFFSSGMAAISTVLLGLLRRGDHVLFQRGLYGGTIHFIAQELEKFGIDFSFADTDSIDLFARGLRSRTRLVYIETPSNPLLGITDIAAVAKLCRSRSVLSAIDNTFASPVNQNPHPAGIDIVIHSATKYLGGHSDLCAGAVVSSKDTIARLYDACICYGGSLNAIDCSLLERSMKTLALRVERQNRNALRLARFLAADDRVSKVHYPGLESHAGHEIAKHQMRGFGGMLSFELKRKDAVAFQKALRLIRPSMSLGGIESIVCSPALTSHRHVAPAERLAMGISDGLLRLSVGIEDADDLRADLERALG